MNGLFKGLRVAAATAGLVVVAQAAGIVAGTLANAANASMYATTAVNVRSQPSTSGSRVGVVYKGDSVTVVSTANGWSRVSFEGRTAYISSAYLTSSNLVSNKAPTTASTETFYTTANLNLRVGPEATSKVSVVVDKGTKLATTGRTSGAYVQVTYNQEMLWAAKSYLSSTAPAVTLPATTVTFRTSAALMIRTTQWSNFTSMGDVASGTLLSGTGVASNGMQQVVYQGNLRWVNGSYVTPVSETVTPVAPATPATTLRYVTTELNVRNAATGKAFAGTIIKGGTVGVTGVVSSGRAQIVHNGAIRWVTARYLSTTKPAATVATTPAAGSINKGYSSGLEKTNANVQAIAWYVWDHWAAIKTQYGWRRDVTPDHPAGRAVDVMIPSYKTNAALGWEIATYFRAHASEYNISYIIFDQKIWSVARNSEGWRSMADRGGDTANHKDHVHINTYG